MTSPLNTKEALFACIIARRILERSNSAKLNKPVVRWISRCLFKLQRTLFLGNVKHNYKISIWVQRRWSFSNNLIGADPFFNPITASCQLATHRLSSFSSITFTLTLGNKSESFNASRNEEKSRSSNKIAEEDLMLCRFYLFAVVNVLQRFLLLAQSFIFLFFNFNQRTEKYLSWLNLISFDFMTIALLLLIWNFW